MVYNGKILGARGKIIVSVTHLLVVELSKMSGDTDLCLAANCLKSGCYLHLTGRIKISLQFTQFAF